MPSNALLVYNFERLFTRRLDPVIERNNLYRSRSTAVRARAELPPPARREPGARPPPFLRAADLAPGTRD
jgi:hypothetical protein